jgi:hypothetical protein
MNENRCVQLATIQLIAAGKTLVAYVKAKHLDASPVDHLRIVKVRCRRCAPLPVRGCPIGRPECSVRGSTRVPREYSSSTRHHARVLLSSLKSSIPTPARSPEDGSSQAALGKQEEAAARKRQQEQEEEVARKRANEEAARKKQQEEDARTKQQEEGARKRAAEEAVKKKQEEDAKKRAAEEAAKKKQEEDAKKRAAEEAANKKQEEDAKKKQKEDAKKRAAEEAAEKQEQEVRPHESAWLRFASSRARQCAVAVPGVGIAGSGDRPDSVCTAPPHLCALLRCMPVAAYCTQHCCHICAGTRLGAAIICADLQAAAETLRLANEAAAAALVRPHRHSKAACAGST